MTRYHGVTANTYKKLIIDSGAVYKNYGESGEVLLGATRGGNTFSIESEYREMEVDGAKGPVSGMRRITAVNASITANFLEFSTTVMQLALTGSDTADYPSTPAKTHDKITRALEIVIGDYLTNIAIIGQVTGNGTSPVVVIIKNVISDGNFEIGAVDNDESVLAVTFKGHFSTSDLDTEPWEIRFPTIA